MLRLFTKSISLHGIMNIAAFDFEVAEKMDFLKHKLIPERIDIFFSFSLRKNMLEESFLLRLTSTAGLPFVYSSSLLGVSLKLSQAVVCVFNFILERNTNYTEFFTFLGLQE